MVPVTSIYFVFYIIITIIYCLFKMKCTIPEIAWHNRDPVYSVDIQPGVVSKTAEATVYRVATGGTDSHVLIWLVKVTKCGTVTVEFASDLHRHQRAVNVVRFAPTGQLLASGDDESVVMLWRPKAKDSKEEPVDLWDDNQQKEVECTEQWQMVKILRGHMEDVYDLSWSPDALFLVSGSVDNSAIIWDITKGQKDGLLKDHKGFVQGVAWDPKNKYIATLSSDRTCRIFNIHSKKVISRIYKSWLPLPNLKPEDSEKSFRLYHDDTFKSFFRRLAFTPCGELLITPSGHIEVEADSEENESKKRFKSSNSTYVFTRHMLNKPVVYLPTGDNYTIAVRCCPTLFELRTDCSRQEDGSNSVFPLPYRVVFAVATQDSVLLYDTQQSVPIGCVSNIHYTRLSDLTWSSDGLFLMVSSTDGYCSIVTFVPGELGTPYLTNQQSTAEVSMECEALADSAGEEEEIRLVLEDTQMELTQPLNDTKLETEELAQPLQDTKLEKVEEKPLVDEAKQKSEDEVLAEPLENTEDVKYLSPKKSEQANVFLTPVKTNAVTTSTPRSGESTPGKDTKKTPKRATLITLSSPKSKKNLYN
ncbi:hypothetical protein B566_EDAN010959 [Ephemera danica]|nr:hypothetical protein B566_EDAN010959 [Ephemera danica]